MGIPCIVAADGAMARIPNGALITMDGATGEIVIGAADDAANGTGNG
jgi:phosphohistidine swiveling domain-containing protein